MTEKKAINFIRRNSKILNKESDNMIKTFIFGYILDDKNCEVTTNGKVNKFKISNLTIEQLTEIIDDGEQFLELNRAKLNHIKELAYRDADNLIKNFPPEESKKWYKHEGD